MAGEVAMAAADRRAMAVGGAVSLLFHLAMVFLLAGAATSGHGRPADEGRLSADSPECRRGAFSEVAVHGRRALEGPYPRLHAFSENASRRRPILNLQGRRDADEGEPHPFRFLELVRGRRDLAGLQHGKKRGLDFGVSRLEPLQAMLVPRLGLKKADSSKLPKLTKYEQPEKAEDGVNVSRDNLSPEELKFKSFDFKKAETDKRRKKKPSLDDLIDAPEDDDPRKRATALEDIVGIAGGVVWGEGSEAREGDLYLAQVENAIRTSFNVPVFLSKEELKKLEVEIEVSQIDPSGRVLAFRLRRQSSSPAFNSAALEAIKRFAPSEGGSKSLPAPKPDMLQYINQRGILVRLEGRKLK
jgi:hypothetical protein